MKKQVERVDLGGKIKLPECPFCGDKLNIKGACSANCVASRNDVKQKRVARMDDKR